MTTLEHAQAYADAGISVIPVRADGSKAAAVQWKPFQERIASDAELQNMFRNGCGIAAIAGRISGFLEVLDFEAGSPFDEWFSLIEKHAASLAAAVVIIGTPSGGHHVLYRCPEGIQGNQKLAMSNSGKVTIETRGEGGYIVTVGSPVGCHIAGKPYTLLQGDLVPGHGERSIPTITAAQRSLLLDAARSFNQSGRVIVQEQDSVRHSGAGGDRPGDLFNQRSTWQDVLTPHGWKVAGSRGDETLWCRPGKDFGFSATTNYQGSDLLYVFSTNAEPFKSETSYSKFAAYALLNHGSDFKAAARDVARRYGMEPKPRQSSEAVEDSNANQGGSRASSAESVPDGSEDCFVMPAHWKRLDVAQVRVWECEPLHPIIAGILAKTNFCFVAAQSQTGKTLLSLYMARTLVQGGALFGKYAVTPVKRVIYFLLEDPDRRAQDRILDTEHEFAELQPEQFIIYVAPGFTLTDDRMFAWMKQVVTSDTVETVVILDTYQKATPGLSSFDDEKQGVILHRLANLTRELNTTIIVMDHFRKEGNGATKGKRREITIDDIKGTGGKVQNADCIILMERTPDKKQIKFQAFSKDFDTPVRILLNVSPRGSKEPKFTYGGDLDQLGDKASDRGAATRAKILGAMLSGQWMSSPELAKALSIGSSTVQNHLKVLLKDGKIKDNACDGRYRRYQSIANSVTDTTAGELAIGSNQ